TSITRTLVAPASLLHLVTSPYGFFACGAAPASAYPLEGCHRAACVSVARAKAGSRTRPLLRRAQRQRGGTGRRSHASDVVERRRVTLSRWGPGQHAPYRRGGPYQVERSHREWRREHQRHPYAWRVVRR